MRLVTQRGTMSFNLDHFVLMLDGKSLLLCDESGEKTYVVGIYDTAERAERVFYIIHARYCDRVRVGYLPKE